MLYLQDSYVKYAHNLSREMNTLGLHAEAANALLLHANLHDWSNTQLNELELGGKLYGCLDAIHPVCSSQRVA